MLDYCRSDVDILRQACLKFRELLMSATGDCVMDQGGIPQWTGAVDPFDSVTIASVCMNVYRIKFLEEEWRVKSAEDTNWLTAKYKNGHMKVLRGDRWVSEDEWSSGRKNLVVPLSPRFHQAGIRWTSTVNRPFSTWNGYPEGTI